LHLRQLVCRQLLGLVLIGLWLLFFLRRTHLTFRHNDLPEVEQRRMLAGVRPGASGCLAAFCRSSAPGRGYASRLQLFVDALVHDFGALIEIFVRAAFFGPHPAFSCSARVRHWRGICDRRRLTPRWFCIRPRRSDRSGRISCGGASGVSFATGQC
jgi:hypothetical protein